MKNRKNISKILIGLGISFFIFNFVFPVLRKVFIIGIIIVVIALFFFFDIPEKGPKNG